MEIIDTEKLKVGTNVYVKRRYSYSEDANGNIYGVWHDEGNGQVVEVDEDYVIIKYDGYSSDTIVCLKVRDFNDHFYSIEVNQKFDTVKGVKK